MCVLFVLRNFSDSFFATELRNAYFTSLKVQSLKYLIIDVEVCLETSIHFVSFYYKFVQ